ncbi:MAG: 23S rRNA (adenine(2503)-C(2))-methyltransferase RlmN [Clostridia bacterium]|nr:23S rRNA (adenine(2503)-C(2))-methyltransferase RlmN [Clostridia bacterium]
MIDILGLTLQECKELAVSLGEKGFRGEQVYRWMQKGAPMEEWTNVPASFKDKIRENCEYRLPKIARKLVSKIDGTVKYLMEMIDGEKIESVFMKYEHGNTVCVSCQAGCRMGCSFCASTLKGKSRDLTASEILGQIAVIGRDTGEKVGGIVMMGIGEPFDNYDNAVKFLHLVSSPDGLNIGLRHISVSTCGVVPGILKLAEEGLPVTLSLSLHSAENGRRSRLMPVNKKYPVEEVLRACRVYFEKTGRRVSFEYTLISGENDSEADAKLLSSVLKKHMGKNPLHVNLIMLNSVDETGYSAPERAAANRFKDALISLGVNATIRRRLGSDINASCGQLRLGKNE